MASYSGNGSLTVDLDFVDGNIVDEKTGFALDIPAGLVTDNEDVSYELTIEFVVTGTRSNATYWEPEEIDENYEFCEAFINGESLDYETGKDLFDQLYHRIHEAEISLD